MAEKDQPIAEVDNFTYQALRRYWTAHDIDRGVGYPFVWDLRIGAVNRWPDDLQTTLEPSKRHIHYTLYLRRADQVDPDEYAMKHGRWPSDPENWILVWSEGTSVGPYNEQAVEEWEARMRPHLKKSEEAFNQWVAQNPPPAQHLPSLDNWGPDRARAELEAIIPEAQRQLVEEDPGGLKWGPQRFIIPEPPPEELGARRPRGRKAWDPRRKPVDPFGRDIVIGINADGQILFWKRGKSAIREKREKGAPGALPVFSVNTVDEAKQILVHFGKKSYFGPEYYWPNVTGNVDQLEEIGELIQEFYEDVLAKEA